MSKKRSKISSKWTYDDERKLLEYLLASRFNFMILFSTLFISVIVQSDSPAARIFLAAFGTLISILISISMIKTGNKLQEMLNLFRSLKPKEHVLAAQSKWILKSGKSGTAVSGFPSFFSSVLIISRYIPVIMVIMFILTFIACIFKYNGFIAAILKNLQ